MNGRIMKSHMPRICLLLFAGYILLSLFTVSWAGNKALVEKSTKELDELNKQAVQQIPDLPKDGTVDLKAKAEYREGEIQFDIYHQKVYDKKEKTAELDNGDSQGSETAGERVVDIDNNKKDTSKEGEKLKNDPEDN
jgi:hypothetical protein